MNSEVQQVFHAVADLTPEQRQRYYAEERIEGEVRREVKSPLAFDEGSTQKLAGELLLSIALLAVRRELRLAQAWLSRELAR